MAESSPEETSTPSAGSAADAAAPSGTGTATAAATDSIEAQLAAARQEAAANHERFVRAMADLENFRKRTVREKDELRQFAAGRVLEDLLPVLDNLALGLAAAKAPNAELKTLLGGIEMVGTQFKSALAGHGLKEIEAAGQTFDPNQHEALSQQPSADLPDGKVIQVVRTGYTLNGRLLRPASVIVSSGPAKEAKG